ncbi:unnamed protein product [Orchesella dallaii]|uniref:Growth arrest-specific protein 2 n=1 Tax=Orchesella dallaii TaxID=48710 RepID=A0ABP1QMP3_9HEXA
MLSNSCHPDDFCLRFDLGEEHTSVHKTCHHLIHLKDCRMNTPSRSNSTVNVSSKMDFLVRRRSFNLGHRELDLSNISITDSPLLSRRRSVSPLMSPMNGSILWNQERSLLPLAHDLADWLSGILGLNLRPDNLMENLQTGVVLCQLARLIEQKAASSTDAKIRPRLIGRVRQNARPGSFFSRDNVTLFINFCKDLGVHPNLMFETSDLVTHGDVRSVLICLMEVGRLSVKYGIDPPALVALEQEMDKEFREDHDASSTGKAPSSDQTTSRTSFGSQTDGEESDDNKENPIISKVNTGVQAKLYDSVDSGLQVEVEQETHHLNCPNVDESFKSPTELDSKVSEVARISGKSCSCVEDTRQSFKMRKLSEGKYLINGRTVFVRLLKGVHVMVRIGGGWETLEEFLIRNDPCRVRKVVRRPSYYQGMNPANILGRPASSPPVMMLGTGLRPCGSSCPTPQRSRHSSRSSLISSSPSFT